MNELRVEQIHLAQNEALMLAFHKKTGRWIASVGDLKRPYQRELTDGATPTEALAELLSLIGGSVSGLN